MQDRIIRARWADYENDLQIACWQVSNNGDRMPITAVYTLEQPGALALPILRLSRAEAQQLFDDMYKAGLRATDAQPTDNQIAAITYHLEDMRRLVFKGE